MRKSWLILVAGGVLIGWIGRGEAGHRAKEGSRALIPQLENEMVTVWKTVLGPHETLGMHRHEHGRVVVALKGGVLTIPQDDGGVHKLVLETGKAYWLDADPPGQLHGDANESGQPLEMMIVEMKHLPHAEPNVP
jgi:hypothetical protein